MFQILRFYGIPEACIKIKAIRALYINTKGVVSIYGKISKEFEINTGVLQGDVLAPFLSVIVIDYVMNIIRRNMAILLSPNNLLALYPVKSTISSTLIT